MFVRLTATMPDLLDTLDTLKYDTSFWEFNVQPLLMGSFNSQANVRACTSAWPHVGAQFHMAAVIPVRSGTVFRNRHATSQLAEHHADLTHLILSISL